MSGPRPRLDGASPLNDESGKLFGYFMPARTYEQWQAQFADASRQLAGMVGEAPTADTVPVGDAPPATLRFDDVVEMLKALSDSDRFRILLELKAGAQNVGSLAKVIDAEIVNTSHHLGVLRNSKLVLSEKEGRFVYYRLNPATFSVGWLRNLLFESDITLASATAEPPTSTAESAPPPDPTSTPPDSAGAFAPVE